MRIMRLALIPMELTWSSLQNIQLEAVLIVLLILAVAGIYIWSGVWAYRDAEQRGKSGLLVALLVLFISWPIGLLVWIALRPERSRGGFDLNDYRVQ